MEGSSWIFVQSAPPPEMLVRPMANAVVSVWSASVLTDAGAVVMACEARRTQHHALVSTNQIAALLRHVTPVPSRRALVVVYL